MRYEVILEHVRDGNVWRAIVIIIDKDYSKAVHGILEFIQPVKYNWDWLDEYPLKCAWPVNYGKARKMITRVSKAIEQYQPGMEGF